MSIVKYLIEGKDFRVEVSTLARAKELSAETHIPYKVIYETVKSF